MTHTHERIDAYLKQHLDRYISDVAELCARPSVSSKGEGLGECADLVVDLLQKRDFDVRRMETPGAPIVVAHADGRSERTLLFYNHYYVQPAEPLDLWTSPPFQPTVRDGALYARGAHDDKGEFVARLAAVDAARAAYDGRLPCGVTFLVEGEEEIGSHHLIPFVPEHADLLRCDGALWEEGGVERDGRPVTILGVRGVLVLELSVETMNQDAHSSSAHVLPNAAWRLQWALGSLKGPDERVRIPGFYDRVKSPSKRDLDLLDALPDHEAWWREEYGVRAFVRDLAGRDQHRAVFEPTCNIQGITAGYQGAGLQTIVPAKASAKLDFRLVPDQDPEDVVDKLREHLDREGFEDVAVETLAAFWPFKTPADDPLVELTTRTGAEVYGKPALIEPLHGGSSPVFALTGPLGPVPVVFAGVGYWDNRAHAPDEHLRIGDFLDGARHVARIVEGFGEI